MIVNTVDLAQLIFVSVELAELTCIFVFCYMDIMVFLFPYFKPIFCDCRGKFVSALFKNLEDGISCDAAEIMYPELFFYQAREDGDAKELEYTLSSSVLHNQCQATIGISLLLCIWS